MPLPNSIKYHLKRVFVLSQQQQQQYKVVVVIVVNSNGNYSLDEQPNAPAISECLNRAMKNKYATWYGEPVFGFFCVVQWCQYDIIVDGQLCER